MNSRTKNLVIASIALVASLPAFALLLSPRPVVAAEREGVVTVGEGVVVPASAAAEFPVTVTAKRPATAKRTPAASAEDPRIAARSRLHDATMNVSTAPNARAATCAPGCAKARPVTMSFEAPAFNQSPLYR